MPDNLPPIFAAAVVPYAPVTEGRRPALHGFVVRKLFAAGEITGRRVVVEACKAELAWSVAEWRRLNPNGWEHERDVEGLAAPHRLPHERAAAVVLNCWNHLHPTDSRAAELWARVKLQLRAGWREKAARTLVDLNWYRIERAKQVAAFDAAVAEYRRLREDV